MNIILFGPNGSGKGTQGALMKKAFDNKLAHIESGGIFREHISNDTELGKKAKAFMERGDLVPDEITIPMVLESLESQGAEGWLLDGFPRNVAQAQKLFEAMKERNLSLNFVVEIDLARNVAKDRIMGRRLCKNDNNHPNNVAIPAICPKGDACRVCDGELFSRPDDLDEVAIDKRHDIYYDAQNGTLAAAYYFKDLCENGECTYITLDGAGNIEETRDKLLKALGI